MAPALPLFVYGTLRAPELVAAVIGHPATGVDASAPGCRVVAYPGRTYPGLVRAAAENAPGALLIGLTAADLDALDRFEGEEYVRRPLTVHVDGHPTAAEVYWPLAAIAPDAPAWRYEDWRRTHPDAGGSGGAQALRARLIAESAAEKPPAGVSKELIS